MQCLCTLAEVTHRLDSLAAEERGNYLVNVWMLFYHTPT